VSTTPRRLRPRPAWAHRDGLVAVRADPAPGLEIRGLLADRMYRYCWGFDERQEHVLAGCFTEDAVWVGDVMGETRVGPHEGRDAVLAYLTGFWPHQRDQRRHVVTNFVVEEIDGDTARGMAYLLLVGSTRAATGLEAAGLYCLDYRRETDGEWRISRLSAGFDVPYWRMEVEEMEPWVRELLGITHHDPDASNVPRADLA
jgi:ketosteroid isomerase-like protein